MTTNTTASLILRPPSTSQARTASAFQKPALDFLMGPWHVTHSTLPMWKTNRNVVITYKPLDSIPGAIDDLVEYSPLGSDKKKTVEGIDKPHASIDAAYNWRGKGWLKIASSQWEILGHGEEEEGWVVTFFAKTMFTPTGIDIYARRRGGLSDHLIQKIKEELKNIGDAVFQEQIDDIFAIKHDW